MNSSIAVLGAGSWGTALALLLARNGVDTTLWAHSKEHIVAMQQQRCNVRFLPEQQFPENLKLESSLQEIASHNKELLIAVPSYAFRSLLIKLAPLLPSEARVAWATKGLEVATHKLLHQVAIEELGEKRKLAAVSGPSFATEVATGLPTALTVAANDSRFAQEFAQLLHSGALRAYTNDDIVGVEIGGAVKNVLAIATGISDGLGYGANARAALITRGLAEMVRLAIKLGAKQETMMGLTGVGDLVLTCTDNQSRNRRFGLALATGKNADSAAAEVGQVVEGVQSTKEIYLLALENGLEMPITEQVYQVLFNGVAPKEAVTMLLSRDIKSE